MSGDSSLCLYTFVHTVNTETFTDNFVSVNKDFVCTLYIFANIVLDLKL